MEIIILMAWLAAAPGEVLKGEAVAVNAGDLLAVRVGGKARKVRLAEIDSPELKQTFFRQAKQYAEKLVLGKPVELRVKSVDRYGTWIADVVLPGGTLLNKKMVEAGWAWHYRVELPVNPRLAKLEYDAWSKKIGLWVEPQPTPPWEFRRPDTIGPPPETASEMDYELILAQGLVGNRRTKLFQWPGCKRYLKIRLEERIVFSSKEQAGSLGFAPFPDCKESLTKN